VVTFSMKECAMNIIEVQILWVLLYYHQLNLSHLLNCVDYPLKITIS